MSIIHDALKKTGQSVIADSDKNKSSRPSKSGIGPEIQRVRPKASANWGPLFVLAVIVLVAGPVLAPLLYNPARSQGGQSVSVGQEVSTMSGQFGVEQAPAPSRAPFASLTRPFSTAPFTLSGVVYTMDPKGSYCLINGKILKQGEQIGGATVQHIGQNQVTLDRNGQKILLTAAAS